MRTKHGGSSVVNIIIVVAIIVVIAGAGYLVVRENSAGPESAKLILQIHNVQEVQDALALQKTIEGKFPENLVSVVPDYLTYYKSFCNNLERFSYEDCPIIDAFTKQQFIYKPTTNGYELKVTIKFNSKTPKNYREQFIEGVNTITNEKRVFAKPVNSLLDKLQAQHNQVYSVRHAISVYFLTENKYPESLADLENGLLDLYKTCFKKIEFVSPSTPVIKCRSNWQVLISEVKGRTDPFTNQEYLYQNQGSNFSLVYTVNYWPAIPADWKAIVSDGKNTADKDYSSIEKQRRAPSL